MERRRLIIPPLPVAVSVQTPVVIPRRLLHPVPLPPPRARHPLAGVAAPPIEHWPDRVYGYHPLLPPDSQGNVICIRKDKPGYSEVSPEINPIARNREMGIDEALAEAIIRAAWAPGGIVWA